MSEALETNLNLDDHVDGEIAACLVLEVPRSFFLYAGAGSGKTYSLVEALRHVRRQYRRTLAVAGQQVGVITYTNAACDEIKRRLEFDGMFHVSTIHSFAWDLIQGFSHDIREYLRKRLAADIVELEEQEAKGRAGTKASATRLAQIASKGRRLERLDTIRSFAYSPSGENSEPNSLNHAEVVDICSVFLTTKPLMQWILVGRFPILLIDESQDTNKRLLTALFEVEKAHKARFSLGLIGDMMQRIYADGMERIEDAIPDDWGRPEKQLNRRCPKRVVGLINKVRAEVDTHSQVPRSDAPEGLVRLFVHPTTANREQVEDAIRGRMAALTGDEDWKTLSKCKVLTLEHRMAASRLGFAKLLEPLLEIDEWRTGVLDGSLATTRFLAKVALPLVTAIRANDQFKIASVLRKECPFLTPQALKAAPDPGFLLQRGREAVAELREIVGAGDPSCGDVVQKVIATGLLEVPDLWIAASSACQTNSTEVDEARDPLPEGMAALVAALDAPFSQVEKYAEYVTGLAPFDTHQGVKGLEFERVMVIMDDAEARGFMFGYEKLLGAKELSPNDLKNQSEGKDTGVDRTRRLFYVTCSRAEESLALVAYTDSPAVVRDHVLGQGWFAPEEVECA